MSDELRYVVLWHDGISDPHYDLMFETSGDALLTTWRAQHWPTRPGDVLVKLPDHRRAYLDYQGPISGNRGFVRQTTGGAYRLIELGTDRFIVELASGERLTLELTAAGWVVR